MRLLFIVLLAWMPMTLSTALLVSSAQRAISQEAKAVQTISELSDRTERAVAGLIRVARLSQNDDLKPDSESAKPFWAALKSLNTSVSKMANAATLQDDAFHSELGNSVKHTAAVITSFELSGAKDDEVVVAITRVEDHITALQTGFGKTSARLRQGGELSAAEIAQLEKVKQNQKELEKKLNAIEAKLKGNAKALAAVREAQKRSREIQRARSTTGDFVASMIALRVLDGLLWGGHWWWGPWGGWYPGYSIVIIDIWIGLDDAVEYDWDYYGATEYDVGYLGAEEILDDADYAEAFDFVENQDFELEAGLGDEELEGITFPTDADFEDELLGLSPDGVEVFTEDDVNSTFDDVVPSLGSEDGLGDLSIPDVEVVPDYGGDFSGSQPDTFYEPEYDSYDDNAPVIVDPGPVTSDYGDFGGFDDFGSGFDDFGGYDDF